jgi:hypothetical protein
MKGGYSGHNGSDQDKGNILKPTFDTLMEEGRKAFEAYRANLEELFLSRLRGDTSRDCSQGHYTDHCNTLCYGNPN